MKNKLHGSVIITYRCNAHCNMCDCFRDPSRPEEEIGTVKNIADVGFKTGDELKSLIQNAAFAVIASEWYENCPFSVMEAQSYGTPVVGANIGGVPELIKDQVTGELFESGNVKDLTDHISQLWNEKEKQQIYRSNCKNIEYDSIEKYCEKLLRLYNG